MADVKNIITLGIGAAPGALTWFITTGLGVGAQITYTSNDVPIDIPAESGVASLDSPSSLYVDLI